MMAIWLAPLAEINHEFPVGQAIGFIADTVAEAAGSASAAVLPSHEGAPVRAAVSPEASITRLPKRPISPASATAVADRHQEILLSPRARALARHANVAPARAAQQPAAAAIPRNAPNPCLRFLALRSISLRDQPSEFERASSLREAVARSMIASAATPTFHVTAQLPLADLIEFARDQKLSVTLLLARACANTIAKHAVFNDRRTPRKASPIAIASISALPWTAWRV